MTAKIVEVLATILEELQTNSSLEKISENLKITKEFDPQTVSAALGLVFDKLLSNKFGIEKEWLLDHKSFRILTDEEIEIVGQENYNYILHLVNVGLIDPLDVELLMNHIKMFPEERISKDEINWIILFSLVDFESDILPGSRFLLHSSDKIN
ncbi:MAG: hypothetical protein CR986_05740 [Ignavibacteriae bacterium]|nr:MAG: hypothetical protein CR986_05740 [Ignavibacteriota bacterium]